MSLFYKLSEAVAVLTMTGLLDRLRVMDHLLHRHETGGGIP